MASFSPDDLIRFSPASGPRQQPAQHPHPRVSAVALATGRMAAVVSAGHSPAASSTASAAASPASFGRGNADGSDAAAGNNDSGAAPAAELSYSWNSFKAAGATQSVGSPSVGQATRAASAGAAQRHDSDPAAPAGDWALAALGGAGVANSGAANSSGEDAATVQSLAARLLLAESELKRQQGESAAAQATLQARVTVLETRLRFLENLVDSMQTGGATATNGASGNAAGTAPSPAVAPRAPAGGVVSALALSARSSAASLNRELREALATSGNGIAALKGELKGVLAATALAAQNSPFAPPARAPKYARLATVQGVDDEFSSRAVAAGNATGGVVNGGYRSLEGGYGGEAPAGKATVTVTAGAPGGVAVVRGPAAGGAAGDGAAKGGSATDELVSGLSSRYSEAMSFLQQLKQK